MLPTLSTACQWKEWAPSFGMTPPVTVQGLEHDVCPPPSNHQSRWSVSALSPAIVNDDGGPSSQPLSEAAEGLTRCDVGEVVSRLMLTESSLVLPVASVTFT